MRYLVPFVFLALHPASVAAQASPDRSMGAEVRRYAGLAVGGALGPVVGAGGGAGGCLLISLAATSERAGERVGYACAVGGSVLFTPLLLHALGIEDGGERWGATGGAVASFWGAIVALGLPGGETRAANETGRDVAYVLLPAAGAVVGALAVSMSRRAHVAPTTGPDGGRGLRLDVRF